MEETRNVNNVKDLMEFLVILQRVLLGLQEVLLIGINKSQIKNKHVFLFSSFSSPPLNPPHPPYTLS
jgi:hypothetical protein